MADKDDDLLDTVNAMADRMGLEGKERRTYVHEHMTRGGYRAVPTYVKGTDDDDDDDSSTFFGSKRKRKDSDRDSDRRRRSSRDDDDWYGN
jgi:hypothetical protein